ncbi:hypothetical protein [Arcticibacter svalbardensis]
MALAIIQSRNASGAIIEEATSAGLSANSITIEAN